MIPHFNGDFLDVDDPVLQDILQSSGSASPGLTFADDSTGPSQTPSDNSLAARIQQNRIDALTLQQEVAQLRKALADKEATLNAVLEDGKQLRDEQYAQLNPGRNILLNGAGKNGIDYENSKFQWEGSLKQKMWEVFGIKEFRLCQKGVCNANMDGRDIVVVMPTGGGKSLTYQLPAILTPGVTLVISPLISLITDQIMHLRNASVEAVKLTGSTPKSEQDAINAKLINMAAGRESEDTEIKLLYCTPEKIAKSKWFVSLLQKVRDGHKLARIVVDEAHCVSQIGHDFRPDYAKLHILRQLFPEVPIMALSATCPPVVLKDLLKVLMLKPTVPGNAASRAAGTVYFTSPLYRPNLHYQVLPKASEGNRVYDEITQWILANHKNDSGIVYCLSKADTENLAKELIKRGGIRTGVYHADRSDGEKEMLHRDWQRGVVKVVCATIAFGLGIDKGDVRFVIHHSMSKSLDGFYQESGRAGRDGKDSDCVLYYRPQDASRLSAMVLNDKDGGSKLHAMLSFAQDLRECRKIQFAKYFSHTSNLSMTSWSTSDVSATQRCGHCDNCTRPAESYERKDVTVEAWQLLRIIEEVQESLGNVTLAKAADLGRSTGKGTFVGGSGAGGRGRGRKSGAGGGRKEAVQLDLDSVAGGKVELKREDIETLLVDLLLRRYLREQLFSTAYSTVSYIQLGERARLLTRFTSKDDLASVPQSARIYCTFRVGKKGSRGRSAKAASASTSASASAAPTSVSATPSGSALVSATASGSTSNRNGNQTKSRKGKEKATAPAPALISDAEDIDNEMGDFVLASDIDAHHSSSDVDVDDDAEIADLMFAFSQSTSSTGLSRKRPARAPPPASVRAPPPPLAPTMMKMKLKTKTKPRTQMTKMQMKKSDSTLMPINISSDEEEEGKDDSFRSGTGLDDDEEIEDEDGDGDEDGGWKTRYTSGPRRKRRKTDPEVLELSSD